MRALRFTFSLLLAAALLGLGASLLGLGAATAGATVQPAGWAPTGGPTVDGGKAVALAADPTQTGALVAAVGVPSDGSGPVIYRTADGAGHWTPVYTPTWDGVGAVAARGNTLYVAGSGQPWQHPLAQSLDAGASWQEIMPVFPGHDYEVLRAAAISSLAPAELFVAGQYRTDDLNWAVIYRGRLQPPAAPQWTPVLTVPGNQNEHGFYTIVTDPATPGLVIAGGGLISNTAGTRQAAIYRSTDAGDTWARTYLGEELPFISLLVHPTQPGIVFAGTADWFGEAATVWRSPDGGQTWAKVATGAGHGLAFVAPDTIYAMADQGRLMRSTTGGAAGTWSDAGFAPDADGLLAASGPALYAGGWNLGVFKSSDGGQSWGPASGGMRSPVLPVSIAVDPQAAGWLLAAAGGAGGFRTTDGGATWAQPASLRGHVANSFALKPGSAPQVAYEGAGSDREGAVRRSADGGLTFTPVYTAPIVMPDGSGGQERIYALAASPAPTNTVYAGGEFMGGGYGQTAVILRSAGDGLAGTWTPVFTSSDAYVQALALDPHDAAVVYAGGWQCGSAGCKGFVGRTRDGGLTWTAVLTPDKNVRSFAIDPQKTRVVYAATDGYQVFKTTDGGDTWAVVRNPPWLGGGISGGRLAIDARVPSRVYLAGWGWVGESTDGGLTWSEGGAINQGMPQMDPQAFALRDDGAAQTLYAGLSGVWSLTLPAPQPGAPATITLATDPPSGWVYADGSLTMIRYMAQAVDQYGNWVADATPIRATLELDPDFGPSQSFTVTKSTTNGAVQGGVTMGAESSVVTVTLRADSGAWAATVVRFLYNAPSGITLAAEPPSIFAGGRTAIVTATLAGLHGGIASNGTAVAFSTTLGTITPANAVTLSGVATATLTSGNAWGTAQITARAGELQAATAVTIEARRVYLPMTLRRR